MRWGGHEEDAAGCSLSTSNLPSGLIPPLRTACRLPAAGPRRPITGLSEALGLGWRSLATAVGVLWPCWRVQMS